MTTVQEENEGKSSFGYPNENAVLLTMLSYGQPALYGTLSAFSKWDYVLSVEFQETTLNIFG
jgi:hypothetical protein